MLTQVDETKNIDVILAVNWHPFFSEICEKKTSLLFSIVKKCIRWETFNPHFHHCPSALTVYFLNESKLQELN